VPRREAGLGTVPGPRPQPDQASRARIGKASRPDRQFNALVEAFQQFLRSVQRPILNEEHHAALVVVRPAERLVERVKDPLEPESVGWKWRALPCARAVGTLKP
jgi:hypothetical protein